MMSALSLGLTPGLTLGSSLWFGGKIEYAQKFNDKIYILKFYKTILEHL
jgi:hypothetical protein